MRKYKGFITLLVLSILLVLWGVNRSVNISYEIYNKNKAKLALKYANEPVINMIAIAQIESSGNPDAHNKRTNAIGLYQITRPALQDYNVFAKSTRNFVHEEMFNPAYCYEVANWYMNTRIPLLLKHYGIEDTYQTRIIAYNAGIGTLREIYAGNRIIPKETRDYIKKYKTSIRDGE